MATRAQVVTGVQVMHTSIDDQSVTAEIFGGEDFLIMGEIVFPVEDASERQATHRLVQQWEQNGTLLTLVEGEDAVISLIDESAAFSRLSSVPSGGAFGP